MPGAQDDRAGSKDDGAGCLDDEAGSKDDGTGCLDGEAGSKDDGAGCLDDGVGGMDGGVAARIIGACAGMMRAARVISPSAGRMMAAVGVVGARCTFRVASLAAIPLGFWRLAPLDRGSTLSPK